MRKRTLAAMAAWTCTWSCTCGHVEEGDGAGGSGAGPIPMVLSQSSGRSVDGGSPATFERDGVALTRAWLDGQVVPAYRVDHLESQAMLLSQPQGGDGLVVFGTWRDTRVQAVLLVSGGVLGDTMQPPRAGEHPEARMLGCAVLRSDGRFEYDLTADGPVEVSVSQVDGRTRRIWFRGHMQGQNEPLSASVDLVRAAL